MELTTYPQIEKKIYTIRGIQVMLDSDLADIYQVETRVLNQAVKRNIDRFPDDFRFQLSLEEAENLKFNGAAPAEGSVSRSQIVIMENTKKKRGQNIKYLPYAFTEQGVAMLSAVLRSNIAVLVSIQIMHAFVNMRKFMIHNASVFQRLEQLEIKQLETHEKLEQVFKALEAGQPRPDKGIFFDGQIFDAYTFVADLIRKADSEIVLIDNFG